jgi:hypothetical protein
MGAPRTTSAASIANGAFFSAGRGLAAFFPPAFAAERKARVRSDDGIFARSLETIFVLQKLARA